jgi:hypothetical protein
VFVCQVYVDVLGRTPEPAAVDSWAGAIDSGKLARAEMARQTLTGREYRERFVESLYRSYLGRPADGPGREGFVQALEHGAPDDLVQSVILGSDEYLARHGGTTRSWIDAVYRDVLQRPVDDSGAVGWGGAVDRGDMTRQDAAWSVLMSREGIEKQVASFYRWFLRREPDGPGLQHYADAWCSCTPRTSIMASIIGSDEYLSKVPF